MAPDHSRTAPGKLPFSRIIGTDDAGSAREGQIEANAAERAQLAKLYKVEHIAALSFDYRLDPLPSQRWRLTGEVKGELTQLCGVTLEPVVEQIREDVSLEYWPEHLIATADEGQPDPEELLESDPPEPLVGGRIDIGALAAEIFASAISPYPRKEGAEFTWSDEKAGQDEAGTKPFAALAKLKNKS
jgi:uncharacterized metal-binding protein YceD (DUF177 family)